MTNPLETVTKSTSRTFNAYIPNGNTTTLKIISKTNLKTYNVTVDTDKVELLSKYVWTVAKSRDKLTVITIMGKVRVNIRNILIGQMGVKTYAVNNDGLDNRVENITTDMSKSVIAEIISDIQKNLPKEKKENIKSAIRDKRYSKEYASQLSNRNRAENNVGAVLTWDIVAKIRDMSDNLELSHYEIATRLKLSRTTVTDVVNYKSWNPYLRENGLTEEEINNLVSYKLLSYDTEGELLQFQNSKVSENGCKISNKDVQYFVKNQSENQVYIELLSADDKYLGAIQILVMDKYNHRCKSNYSILKFNSSTLSSNGLKLKRSDCYSIINDIVYSLNKGEI